MTIRPTRLPAALLGLGVVLAAVGASAAPAAPSTPSAPTATTAQKATTTPAAASAASAAGPAATARAPATAPRVSDAWIAEAPPTARHNAAYLVVRNGGRADTLLAVETPVAAVVELHEMRMDQGVMRMRQEKSAALAANAELRLAPGGRHLMLINMKRPLQAGERVPLTLRFRRAGAITVMAEVRALEPDAGDAPDHSGHHAH